MTACRGLVVAMLVALGLACAGVAAADPSGRDMLPPSGRTGGTPAAGALCDSCPDPVVNAFGVEFRQGELWVLTQEGTLTQLSACQPVRVLSVQGFSGFATSLGYDESRDEFLVADGDSNSRQIFCVSPLSGLVLRALPSPCDFPIGVAFDPSRDAYWITDFASDSIYAIDADTGALVTAFALPPGHCAGAAYDPIHDTVYISDRIATPMTYYVSCTTGAVVGAFPLPDNGFISWEDNTFAPDGSLWIHNFSQSMLYCVGSTATPARKLSWGSLKNLYR